MTSTKRTTTPKRVAGPAAIPAPGVVDLSDIMDSIRRQDEGIVVDILAQDGKTPLGLRIRVAGPDSKRAIAAHDEYMDEIIAAKADGTPTAASYTERSARTLAKMTLGWEGTVRYDGKDHEFSEAAALELYTRAKFILDQVNRAAGDRNRFTKG